MNLPDRPERAMSLRPRLNLTMLQYQDAPPRPVVHVEPKPTIVPRAKKVRSYDTPCGPGSGTKNPRVMAAVIAAAERRMRENLDKVLKAHPLMLRSQVRAILDLSVSGSKQTIANWKARGWIIETGRLVMRETEWKKADGGY